MLKQPALPVLLGSFGTKEASGPDAWHCDRLQALGSGRRSLRSGCPKCSCSPAELAIAHFLCVSMRIQGITCVLTVACLPVVILHDRPKIKG